MKGADYQLLPLLEVPSIFTALAAGQFEAGVMSPPTNARAKKAGFVELINIAKEGPEFDSVAIGSSRSYGKANEEIVRRVVRACAEGIQAFKNNKTAALRMIERQLKVSDPEVREDIYSQFREYLEYPLRRPQRHGSGDRRKIVEKEPAAKKPKAGDVMDMRFVAELGKKSGGR